MGATPFREGWLTSIQMFILSQNTSKVHPEWCLTSYPGTYPWLPPSWPSPVHTCNQPLKHEWLYFFCQVHHEQTFLSGFFRECSISPPHSLLSMFWDLELIEFPELSFQVHPNPGCWVFRRQRCSLALHWEFQQQSHFLSSGFCHRHDSLSPFGDHLQTTPSTFI